MLDIGMALEAPESLGPRRHGEADERHERDKQRHGEGHEQGAVQKRRQGAPQIEHGENEKGREHDERPEQRLPYALADEGKPAQVHAPFEAAGERLVLRGVRGRFLSGKQISHHLH